MKIRTITIGVPGMPGPDEIYAVGQRLEKADTHFRSAGYEVQSRRASLPHWDNGMGQLPESEREARLYAMDSACADARIDFCSMGVARHPGHVDHMTHILAKVTRLTGSAEISSLDGGLNPAVIDRSATAILTLAEQTRNGFGNFRFGAACCLRPGIPFFPGSYHAGTNSSLSIGLENSDILLRACEMAKGLPALRATLRSALEQEIGPVVERAKAVADDIGADFLGVDTSIAPSLEPDESIVRAFEALGTTFGKAGTLAICSEITRALQTVNVDRVGYCGLMLPVLEDSGLAAAASCGTISITHLLAYAAVCGVGVDMVPIPGDVRHQQIAALLLDTATLSVRLVKPLSVRVLPVAGKTAGEMSSFDSPFVCNAPLLPL